MRAATHGCNEGSIEAGWLGQSHLPVMLNYVPTTTLSKVHMMSLKNVPPRRANRHTFALYPSPPLENPVSMQRATPWFVGPAIHGARAAQLFLRSRAHSRERARCAHTGAQQIDAQRPRLVAH